MTGGGAVAAAMLGKVWAESTWATRTSQWNKFDLFCEEDDRVPFPADEGAVLAYIGYLRQEGRVSASSLPQYISAISRYHVLAGLESPTRTPLIAALMTAYQRDTLPVVPAAVRIGVSATVMRRILRYGLQSAVPRLVRDAAMCVGTFLTGSRASSVGAMQLSDYGVDDAGTLTMRLVHRKARNTRDPLVLTYPLREDGLTEESPQALLAKWVALRPTSDLLWALDEENAVRSATVTQALRNLLSALDVPTPQGCIYSSHSIRIGTYNEMRALGLPAARILHHLGWASASMQATYYDPRISVTADSEFWFGHLRGT